MNSGSFPNKIHSDLNAVTLYAMTILKVSDIDQYLFIHPRVERVELTMCGEARAMSISFAQIQNVSNPKRNQSDRSTIMVLEIKMWRV